ncbi:SDR family NAD(P)-dependent oxidoreductase [Streptomyces olivaceoviridis]|uniref:SDR family NAD(P)-dependent oxidoreductase n=1 Tax=Streptomyces olivaceoviridis TaxID=1921 RepID=UPI00369B56AE
MSVWFVTGASRGLGLEIVKAALERGEQVVAAARSPRQVEAALPPGRADQLLVVPLDVTDQEQAQAAVKAAVARFGGIDVLVNNAGRGLVGAVEETSDAEARAVFDINVFGLLTVLRAVAPVMRAAGRGRVVNISSTGGVVAWAGWGVYSASKFAVEGITEALRLDWPPWASRSPPCSPDHCGPASSAPRRWSTPSASSTTTPPRAAPLARGPGRTTGSRKATRQGPRPPS